jgi:3-oxoadipate enol-lactonase
VLHHVVDGPEGGPPVVLSNSLGSTTAMWDPQVPALAARHLVVRYDHRGHGASPVPPGPYTIAELGQDVLALLDSLAIERAPFCGLSLGGMVGIWLAAHAPERIDRLVLVNTSARLPREAWLERARMVRAEGLDSIADVVVGRWFTPAFAAREPELVGRMRVMIAATPAEGYASCCDAIAAMDLRGDLARIRAPSLVAAGADDPAIPPDHSVAIAAALDGARLVVIPDAAHLANVEQHELVTRLILEHLEGARDVG